MNVDKKDIALMHTYIIYRSFDQGLKKAILIEFRD